MAGDRSRACLGVGDIDLWQVGFGHVVTGVAQGRAQGVTEHAEGAGDEDPHDRRG
jgi:hypothetical protein